ncbi:MAG: tetratricopeptide repeat protein [Vampirovibrionia bacterium]
MKRRYPITLAICLTLLTSSPSVYGQYEYNMEANYAKYYDMGIQYYNNSQFSNAIEQFTQALKLAPLNSAIRNNLAVSYISRGTYFHNKLANYNSAADNYRDAIYYLKYDAPGESKPSPNASGNLDIALKNLENAELNLGHTSNQSFHFNKAKELRAKGEFKAAIVEYFLALEQSPPNAEAYEAIGDMYRVLQNNDRAASAYEKALSTNNNNAELQVKLGLAYEKTDKLNQAITAFNQASQIDPKNMDALNSLEKIWQEQIKMNPRNAAAHANLGTILQKKGNYNGALEEYNAAELIDPNNILVRLNLGTLYQAKGDLQTAIKAYDTILSIEPKNVLAHFYKSTALKQMKNYDAATKELNTILSIDPNNTMAKQELIEIAKAQGGTGNSNLISILKDAADNNPNNAKSQYDVAFEAHSKGDLDTAIRYYKKAIILDPRMSDAYSNLGAALMANKDYDSAKENLQKASELDPTNDNVLKLLSDLKEIQGSNKYQEALKLHEAGKVNEAIKLYEAALEAEPNNTEIYINLGAANQSIKAYQKAIDYYKKALSLDPKSSLTYYYMGTVYHAQNDLNEAIKNYKQALDFDPKNQQAIEALKSAQEGRSQIILSDALDAYNKKDFNRSKALINGVLTNDPNNAVAYYYMGLVNESQNSVTTAITNYKKATQLDPKMENAFYALAIALDKVNSRAEAKVAYQKFLGLAGNKNDTFTKYAAERLRQLSQ